MVDSGRQSLGLNPPLSPFSSLFSNSEIAQGRRSQGFTPRLPLLLSTFCRRSQGFKPRLPLLLSTFCFLCLFSHGFSMISLHFCFVWVSYDFFLFLFFRLTASFLLLFGILSCLPEDLFLCPRSVFFRTAIRACPNRIEIVNRSENKQGAYWPLVQTGSPSLFMFRKKTQSITHCQNRIVER